MNRQNWFFSALMIAGFGVGVDIRDATAGDYVWARSAFGNGNFGRNYSGMANGYGGYYVPRNGYGNNYESRRPFTNPNGYIVPANTGNYSGSRQSYVPAAPTQPTIIRQPVAQPLSARP